MVALLELLDGIGGVGGAGGSATVDLGGDADELLGLGEGKRAEKNGVDDGEDDDVGADAEGEDDHGDDGEGGVAAEGAEGEAEVLEEDVEPGQAAGGALVFAGLLDSAEADEGAAAGFFFGHAEGEIFFGGQVEVGGDFGFEVGVVLWLMEEGEDAGEGLAEGWHQFSPSGAMARTRVMTVERRRQCSVSATSCLRPARVME